MVFQSPLIVVRDMEKSLDFYQQVLRLSVVLDFGANKTLTGGLVLQTLSAFQGFITPHEVTFGSNSFELYFEEDDFDAFLCRLETCDIVYLHPVKEHAWGQRVVRFYDPDKHIIEVGENMKTVCRRFWQSGMKPQQIAERMDVPLGYVEDCLRESPC